jgi:hypothetical protein
MGKGHYPGGSSLIGEGPIIRSKGRSGGIGDASSSAVRDALKKKDREAKRKLAKQVRENQRKLYKLSRQWAGEKAERAREEAKSEERLKSSPLAAALRRALDAAEPGS